MKKITILLSVLLIAFSSCKKDSDPVSKEAILKQGFWHLETVLEQRFYETVANGNTIDSGVEILSDTILGLGSVVIDFEDDSLRAYEDSELVISYAWKIDDDELIWYRLFTNPFTEDIDTIRIQFHIDQVNSSTMNLSAIEKDTLILDVNTYRYDEFVREYEFKNTDSYSPADEQVKINARSIMSLISTSK